MSRQLRITPGAQQDIEDIACYIAMDSLEAALRFERAAVDTAVDMLEDPEAFPIVELEAGRELGMRKRHIRGFPNHLIFYIVTDQAVVIQRIIHGARDLPAVLHERLDGH